MRLLVLLLTFSLTFNNLLSYPKPELKLIKKEELSQPEPSKVKELVNKVKEYAKTSGNFLISENGQTLLIAAYLAPYILQNISLIFSKTTPIALTALPESIQNAVKVMDVSNINFKTGEGLMCYTDGKNIVLGNDLFTHSTKAQAFVVGHELAHIKKNHILKMNCALLAMYIFSVVFNFSDEKIKQVKRYCKRKLTTNEIGKRCTSAVYKVISIVKDNPLIAFGILMTLFCKLSQYHEKEADMVAATTLNNAQGGIDFFEKALKDYPTDTSWKKYVTLRPIANYISNFFGWWSHPDTKIRIAYLTALAEQQKNA